MSDAKKRHLWRACALEDALSLKNQHTEITSRFEMVHAHEEAGPKQNWVTKESLWFSTVSRKPVFMHRHLVETDEDTRQLGVEPFFTATDAELELAAICRLTDISSTDPSLLMCGRASTWVDTLKKEFVQSFEDADGGAHPKGMIGRVLDIGLADPIDGDVVGVYAPSPDGAQLLFIQPLRLWLKLAGLQCVLLTVYALAGTNPILQKVLEASRCLFALKSPSLALKSSHLEMWRGCLEELANSDTVMDAGSVKAIYVPPVGDIPVFGEFLEKHLKGAQYHVRYPFAGFDALEDDFDDGPEDDDVVSREWIRATWVRDCVRPVTSSLMYLPVQPLSTLFLVSGPGTVAPLKAPDTAESLFQAFMSPSMRYGLVFPVLGLGSIGKSGTTLTVHGAHRFGLDTWRVARTLDPAKDPATRVAPYFGKETEGGKNELEVATTIAACRLLSDRGKTKVSLGSQAGASYKTTPNIPAAEFTVDRRGHPDDMRIPVQTLDVLGTVRAFSKLPRVPNGLSVTIAPTTPKRK